MTVFIVPDDARYEPGFLRLKYRRLMYFGSASWLKLKLFFKRNPVTCFFDTFLTSIANLIIDTDRIAPYWLRK